MNAPAQSMAASFVAIEGRSLAKALKLMSAVVEKRNTYPILGMVRLSVIGPSLVITGTDLDMQAVTTLDVNDAAGDWSACVDVSVLARIARLAGPALLRITPMVRQLTGGKKPAVESYVSITSDDASYEITTHDADSFPDFPGERGTEIERFGNGSLAALLRKVSWCVSSEETRYYLNGVYWCQGPDGKQLVATDGHRMAVCTYAADKAESRHGHIIPAKTVRVLEQFAGDDVVVHAVGDTKLEFAFGATVLRSKTIEGTYPGFTRLIPKSENTKFRITAPATSIIAAVDRAMAMKQGGGNTCALRFHRGDDGKAAVEHRNPAMGTAKAAMQAEWPDDAPEFGLNGQYVRDIASRCVGAVTMHGIDGGAPFRITDEDETVLRVQMPMRV